MKFTKVPTVFSCPLYFKCLSGCGLCCSYKVEVTRNDIDAIVTTGKSPEQFLRKNSEDRCGYFAGSLKKEGNKCIFMDEDKRCTIYPNRPTYCRYFPFFIEMNEQVDIDLSCPGIGEGDEVSEEYLRGIIDCEKDRIAQNQREEFTLPEEFLSPKKLYVSSDIFKKAWNEIDVIRISHYNIRPWLLEFFQFNKGVNAHKSPRGELVLYTFDLKRTHIYINDIAYSIDKRGDYFLSEEEKYILQDYIRIWFQREIFYRFCLINAFASISRPSVLDIAYEFIGVLIRQILSIRDVLYFYWSGYEPEDGNNIGMLKESIRALDGRLRSKCQEINLCQR